MNIILDEPPRKVWIGGDSYELNTDFRLGLKFFRLIRDNEFSDEERAETALRMFFKKLPSPENLGAALEAMLDFIHCSEKPRDDADGKKVFDFDVDANRIYAAFLQVYGIDLNQTDMHWWRFMALLNGLPDGTKLSQVMSIRDQDVPKQTTENGRYIERLRRMKAVYSLETQEDVERKVINIFDRW